MSATKTDLSSTEDLSALVTEIVTWQRTTFPYATPASVAEHLRREAEELIEYPVDPEEIADIFILLVASADLAGVDLAEAVANKMTVNQARRWGQPDAAGVVEHTGREEKPKPTTEQLLSALRAGVEFLSELTTKAFESAAEDYRSGASRSPGFWRVWESVQRFESDDWKWELSSRRSRLADPVRRICWNCGGLPGGQASGIADLCVCDEGEAG